MINLDYAEVHWDLNGYCKFQCTYCPAQFKNGELKYSADQYLAVVDKLQHSRYKHHSKILWQLGGGEPLHFPHLGTVLKKIKKKPSIVRLNTSGDDTWFSLYSVLNLVDEVELTYHSWQNNDIVDLILEQAIEKNVKVSITVPLLPGLIFESREKVKRFQLLGYACNEQVLRNDNGQLYQGYSIIDENRIHGRPDSWLPAPVIRDPNKPDPNYIDLSVANSTDPVYTGLPCYAGVDWLHIGPNGFVSYSRCGGRSEHFNVFDPNWQAPNNHFPCTVIQCRHDNDRKKIRIAS